MKTNGEVFNELKAKLEEAGLMPDEYLLMNHHLREDGEMIDFSEAICSVNFGSSEGIYLDIELNYKNAVNQKNQIHFATGKTLGDATDDFYKMSIIAGECSMLLNGNGCKVKNNTKSILILDAAEASELNNALNLQIEFNEGLNKSNETVYGLIDALNPPGAAQENEKEDELEDEI